VRRAVMEELLFILETAQWTSTALGASRPRADRACLHALTALTEKLPTPSDELIVAILHRGGALSCLTFDAYGCRALQLLLSRASLAVAWHVAFALAPFAVIAAAHFSGNFVVQCIVRDMPENIWTSTLLPVLLRDFNVLAHSMCGCRVYVRILEGRSGADLLVPLVVKAARELLYSHYGHHLLQVSVTRYPSIRDAVLPLLLEQLQPEATPETTTEATPETTPESTPEASLPEAPLPDPSARAKVRKCMEAWACVALAFLITATPEMRLTLAKHTFAWNYRALCGFGKGRALLRRLRVL
jgi:hypothetical protein